MPKPDSRELRRLELERIARANGELPEQIYRRDEPWAAGLNARDYAFAVQHGMYVDHQAYPYSDAAWKQRWPLRPANQLDWRPPAPRPGFEHQEDGGWTPAALGVEPPGNADPG